MRRSIDLMRLWTTRHERKPSWAKEYQDSWNAPHRRFLVDHLRRLGPHTSILELGCNSGPNFIAISSAFSPPPRLHGIDINGAAVDEAQRFFAKRGWTHATFEQAALPESLASIPDRSWDCIIAVAVLMHLRDIETTLQHATRIARRHVVFMDMHLFQPFPRRWGEPAGWSLIDRWARNWWEEFAFSSDWQIEVSELPPGVNRIRAGDVNALIVGCRTDADGVKEGVG